MSAAQPVALLAKMALAAELVTVVKVDLPTLFIFQVVPLLGMVTVDTDQSLISLLCHWYKLVASVGFFNVFQPGGICRAGSVNHQQTHQKIWPVGRDGQSVAGKGVRGVRMVKAE